MDNQYQGNSEEKQESRRLHQLQQYNILDSASEAGYNDIAVLASRICEAPIAIIGFIDARRQWVKSSSGVSLTEIDRTQSFCNYAIQHPMEMMMVEDFTKDARFQMHPYVAGEPHLAFYAGMPLTNKQGYALGTICVLDTKPRCLTAQQTKALRLFSIQLMHMLELRRIHHEHETLQAQLQNNNAAADYHIEMITAQIRQSVSDIVSEKSQWEGWYHTNENVLPGCTQVIGQMEVDIKAIIEKMLSHYPDSR
ncbi:MAG: GAF domain-containing protein [Williamsia sp.]|nr:GAF domain-containing protein [Williamsia sp.]